MPFDLNRESQFIAPHAFCSFLYSLGRELKPFPPMSQNDFSVPITSLLPTGIRHPNVHCKLARSNASTNRVSMQIFSLETLRIKRQNRSFFNLHKFYSLVHEHPVYIVCKWVLHHQCYVLCRERWMYVLCLYIGTYINTCVYPK